MHCNLWLYFAILPCQIFPKNMVKTALVTGAASGLGYEFSLLLAKNKYDLILIDISVNNLKLLKKELINKYNSKIELLVEDLSKINIAESIYNKFKNKPIHILINNAGFGLFGPFSESNWEKNSTMLHLHVLTTTHLTKLFLPGMIKRKEGKILNVSSLAAFQPGPLMSLYYASKAYILSFSEAISNELKGTGVTVTVLCPGPTKTEFQKVVSNSSSNNKITFNMACPKAVVFYGYNAMLKGKTVAIPGFFNKFLSILPRILPRNATAALVKTIQEKNREKSRIITQKTTD